jgi:hypothetical protein
MTNDRKRAEMPAKPSGIRHATPTRIQLAPSVTTARVDLTARNAGFRACALAFLTYGLRDRRPEHAVLVRP